ncbi:potassium-transporting ATPase subunit F [Phormidium sp. FACHB-1136]|uniref:potassium-transporting ATPase subunit F n=1 Tax=Phormidium sp. FACHB-1136 TaxID=2692848 RepID=UPI001682F9FD|nr:potassium-transporting ATPase subunit F [Phormidium sp. FACHB-1136]MBD2428910.1 potassium-transporting ATPase subunit F [Phormidium sp. FACHB-1136]
MKPTLPKILLLGLLANTVITPALHAATGSDIPRGTAYAIGLLGLVVVGLAIYLAAVIVQPEKF